MTYKVGDPVGPAYLPARARDISPRFRAATPRIGTDDFGMFGEADVHRLPPAEDRIWRSWHDLKPDGKDQFTAMPEFLDLPHLRRFQRRVESEAQAERLNDGTLQPARAPRITPHLEFSNGTKVVTNREWQHVQEGADGSIRAIVAHVARFSDDLGLMHSRPKSDGSHQVGVWVDTEHGQSVMVDVKRPHPFTIGFEGHEVVIQPARNEPGD